MCSPLFISQPSWDLGEYLPSELPFEETLAYQSPEGLIRSFKTNTLPPAHRIESEVFNPTNDDIEALSALSIDDLFSTMNSDSDDITDYFHERSTVVPHIPNLSSGSELHVTYPLSPSSINRSENQRRKMSSTSSPLHLECADERKFHIFDQVTGRARRPYLHEFIRLLLENDEYSYIIQYIDRKQGIFKLYKPKEIAELWKRVKGRNSDNSKFIFIIQIMIINIYSFF
jgi:hypothetical protein